MLRIVSLLIPDESQGNIIIIIMSKVHLGSRKCFSRLLRWDRPGSVNLGACYFVPPQEQQRQSKTTEEALTWAAPSLLVNHLHVRLYPLMLLHEFVAALRLSRCMFPCACDVLSTANGRIS